MHAVDCECLLSQDNPDALLEKDEARFREYLVMLEVLSTNRDLQRILQEEEAMLSQVKYSDLPSYGLGMEQGRQEGEAAVLLRLLERKYGPSTAAACRERIMAADAETLLKWSERILTAETVEEIFH